MRAALHGCMLVCSLYISVDQVRGGDTITLGTRTSTTALVPMDQIDHAAWDALLARYVDRDGFVDYRAWKGSTQDVAALERYLESLSPADPTARTSREAYLAFWINAYNALTMHGILREYPTSSIRNHTPKLWGYNIWDDLLLIVGSKSYSLNTMEHQVLRKVGDNRVHFAIVCASIGCPRLRSEAYTTARLEEQLADNARAFFGNTRNLRVDRSSKTIHVSSILKWFAEDFGDTAIDGLISLEPYLPDNAKQLLHGGQTRIAYLSYDWNLNDQATRKVARK